MTQVFKPIKVILKAKEGEAELPAYIVCDNERNMVCAGVTGDFFSEEEAKRMSDRCNEIVDKDGIISYEKLQKIAEEVHHKYVFEPLAFAGLDGLGFMKF